MRSPLYALLLPLSLLLALAATGSDAGDCQPPEPVDVFCDTDEDCAAGQVCNLFQFCVDPFVELALADDWYAAGERVSFTVDPNGLPIEIGGDPGVPPYTVERWSEQSGTWQALRIGTLYGCRTTGCVDGVPVELCVDPGLPWCHEHDAPFTDSWDGTHWEGSDEPCGGATVTIMRRVTAGPGNYRVVYHYGADALPGRTFAGACAPQTESTSAPFGIR